MKKQPTIFDFLNEEEKRYRSLLKENGLFYLSDKYIPENPLFRYEHIKTLAMFIKTTINENLNDIISLEGPTGTGKTMSFLIVKEYLNKLIEDGLLHASIVYINGKNKTIIDVLVDVIHSLGYKVPRRGYSFGYYVNTLIDIAKELGHIHICVDEIDKVRSGRNSVEDLLYYLSRTQNISATIITNNFQFFRMISDPRVRGSITKDKTIIFERYNYDQCYQILKERCELAFVDGAIDDDAIKLAAEITSFEQGNIRSGLEILRKSVQIALSMSKDKITKEIVDTASEDIRLRKYSEKILALPASLRLIIMAAYFLRLGDCKTVFSSRDIYYKQNEYRVKLGKKPLTLETVWNALSELVEYGFLDQIKRGRGKGRGIERMYELIYPLEAISYAFKRDPELKDLFDDELQSIKEIRKDKFREYMYRL
jgi:orc1/cdc6 family replication initiation protein